MLHTYEIVGAAIVIMAVTVAGQELRPRARELGVAIVVPIFERWLQHGAIAAALVEVATETIMLGGALILLPRGTLDRRIVAFGGRVALAGGALLVVTTLLRPWFVPLSMVVGGLAFIAVAMALRVVTPAELCSLRGAAVQRLARRSRV